jgi:hypothetical protein
MSPVKHNNGVSTAIKKKIEFFAPHWLALMNGSARIQISRPASNVGPFDSVWIFSPSRERHDKASVTDIPESAKI